MAGLSLIIADGHQLVRTGLCKLLAEQTDLHVAAQCRTGKEALAYARRRHAASPRFS